MDTWNLAYRPDSFWTRLRTRRLSVPVIAAAVLAVTLACSDSSGTITPPEPVPTTLTAVEGSGLQAPAGTVLPEGPTVQLRDQHGKPVAGVDVTFSVTAGGGSVVYPRVATDFLGRARTTWILGDEVGTPQTLMASVSSLSADFQAQVIQPVPGQSYHGRSEYVQFFPGELPVVLSAGHGGDLRPTEIPDRTVGTTVQDLNTLDLALRVRQTVKDQTGYWPHLVVSHLHRIKLDPNREIVEAAQGNPEAERAWWEYHTFLKKARHMVEAEFGEGFYIDLHGHGHTIQRLELGYLLSISQLALADEALRGVAGQSSLSELARKPGVDFVELIRGPSSLGSLLDAEGFPSVPSQNDTHPGTDPYFTGGYSTVVHGSRDGGTVSGVQIECNFTGVRDSAQNRQGFAQALTEALHIFFPAHFGMELSPTGVPPAKAAMTVPGIGTVERELASSGAAGMGR
jgi:hypothetical protein